VNAAAENAARAPGGHTGLARLLDRAHLALHLRLAASGWHGPSFTGLPPGARQLALTYDDGPNDACTPQLLEILARHGARATFFLIGRFVLERPDLARAIAAGGHAVGNHTHTHPDLTTLAPDAIAQELDAASRAIEDATGARPRLFRPPFGRRRRHILATARARGMTPVMWRAACYDWKAGWADGIARTLRSQLRGGEVIQLHDGGHRRLGLDRSHCVQATDELLRQLRAEGYEFVTVAEMMQGANGGAETEDTAPGLTHS